MSRDERARLRDIAQAIAAIRSHLAGEDVVAAVLHDALLFQLVVIGEAVKGLGDELREAEPEVPWRSISGLRDMIAHQYFQIEMDRILAIIERDLPGLDDAVGRLLAGER